MLPEGQGKGHDITGEIGESLLCSRTPWSSIHSLLDLGKAGEGGCFIDMQGTQLLSVLGFLVVLFPPVFLKKMPHCYQGTMCFHFSKKCHLFVSDQSTRSRHSSHCRERNMPSQHSHNSGKLHCGASQSFVSRGRLVSLDWSGLAA